MADNLTETQRKFCMASVKSKDTKPEIVARSYIHRLGYRYRLHRHDLPGRPDLVFPSRNKVIFVHGCFWHRHRCKKGQSMPATRRAFWKKKLEGNQQRDQRNRRKLRSLGWSVLTIWECQIKRNPAKIESRIVDFLGK